MNITSRSSPKRQLLAEGGFFLVEAMIAVAIFAMGVLAVIAMQAVAVRETTESKMRSDASYLADKIVGDLSTIDLRSTAATTSGSTAITVYGGDYTATDAPAGASPTVYGSWQNIIGRTLPNGKVTISIENPADALDATKVIYSATVRVEWTFPGAAATDPPRSFSQTSRLVD